MLRSVYINRPDNIKFKPGSLYKLKLGFTTYKFPDFEGNSCIHLTENDIVMFIKTTKVNSHHYKDVSVAIFLNGDNILFQSENMLSKPSFYLTELEEEKEEY